MGTNSWQPTSASSPSAPTVEILSGKFSGPQRGRKERERGREGGVHGVEQMMTSADLFLCL